MDYPVNKGIGRHAEFQGLQAQYLYFFVIGLLVVFLVFIVLYMAGISQWFCLAFGVFSTAGLAGGIFHLNRKYGPNGLMKLSAIRSHPFFIINRKRISNLIKYHKHEKSSESIHTGK